MIAEFPQSMSLTLTPCNSGLQKHSHPSFRERGIVIVRQRQDSAISFHPSYLRALHHRADLSMQYLQRLLAPLRQYDRSVRENAAVSMRGRGVAYL